VDGQGFGETWASCMAAAVEKVIEGEGDLGCKSGFRGVEEPLAWVLLYGASHTFSSTNCFNSCVTRA
jgi:hypothetical protein